MKKNVLLTGCSRGVGLETTKTLIKKGYVVYGISRTLTEEYKALMKSYPEEVKFMSYDLSNVNDIQKELFKNYIPNSVALHGYVNNAAIAYDDIITNLNIERLETMFKVNVYSPFNIVKYAIRNMLYNRVKGSIIHISSISVHTGYKGLAMYAGSKGALEGFSKNTAREWGERGIRSNCLVAGFMDTDMSSTLPSEMKDRIFKRTSLKKPTELKSVAQTIEFLLSENANSITGQNFHVDSGTI
jgi:3-oxoacyl-[acyl-carrier protein] reductase